MNKFLISHITESGKETMLYFGRDRAEARQFFLDCREPGRVIWHDLINPARRKYNKPAKPAAKKAAKRAKAANEPDA